MSLSLSALHMLWWLCLWHSTFGGVGISICSCLLHTASCIVASCVAYLVSVSLHVHVSEFPCSCVLLHHCQTLSSCTSSLCPSHFISLCKLCLSPTLIDISISRCYWTLTAFLLHHHTHLGVLVCWFRVFVVFPTLKSVSLALPIRMVSDASPESLGSVYKYPLLECDSTPDRLKGQRPSGTRWNASTLITAKGSLYKCNILYGAHHLVTATLWQAFWVVTDTF